MFGIVTQISSAVRLGTAHIFSVLNMSAHPIRVYILMHLGVPALQRLIGAHFREQSQHLIILSDFE
jgi:hypothetical protein